MVNKTATCASLSNAKIFLVEFFIQFSGTFLFLWVHKCRSVNVSNLISNQEAIMATLIKKSFIFFCKRIKNVFNIFRSFFHDDYPLECHWIRNAYLATIWASSSLENDCHSTRQRFSKFPEVLHGNDLSNIE